MEALICEFCNKVCKSKNSYVQHKIRCKANPNRIEIFTWADRDIPESIRRKMGWSKGLTKDKDVRVMKMSKALIGKSLGVAATPKREKERRKKISNSMKRNPNSGGLRPNSGRGKKGWFKGIYCRSTYELVYVIYNIDHNIEFKPCERVYSYIWNKEIHKYYPDFELSDGTIIEIKGYSDAQTEAKINSVNDRHIEVLYEKDLKYAFDYIRENYTFKKLEDLYE